MKKTVVQTDELYILNEKNKLITKDYIEDVLKQYKINYVVKNIDLFYTAMTHVSYTIRCCNPVINKSKQNQLQSGNVDPISDKTNVVPLRQESSDRLEFLGDSVIHMCLAEYFYNRYDSENEGFMTKLRTKIEQGDTLSNFTKSLNLHQYILISRYIESIGSREKNYKLQEDAFEAFVGALYLDSGSNNIVCSNFIIALIESHVDFAEMLCKENNYKDTLLQYFHTLKWKDPEYGNQNINGPENQKIFTMYVKCKKKSTDDGIIVGTGVASTKQKAEQEAAKNALIYYGLLKEVNNTIISANDDDFILSLEDE